MENPGLSGSCGRCAEASASCVLLASGVSSQSGPVRQGTLVQASQCAGEGPETQKVELTSPGLQSSMALEAGPRLLCVIVKALVHFHRRGVEQRGLKGHFISVSRKAHHLPSPPKLESIKLGVPGWLSWKNMPLLISGS